jgi:hypothetical protein
LTAVIAGLASNQQRVDAMNKNQPTRPVEEGVDPLNEKIFLDRLKTADKEKKSAAPGLR